MAAGDINDAASQIPGIALADDSGDPSDLGAGYALLKFKNGLPVWLPNGGAVRTALARGATSQLSALTEEASPLDADLFLMERASDGALRKVQAQNLPGGGGGSPAALLLDYRPSTDFINGVAVGNGTFTDLFANQSFTVGNGTSRIVVAVTGAWVALDTDSTSQAYVRIQIDSAGTPIYRLASSTTCYTVQHIGMAPFGAFVDVGTLAAGAHTVRLQGAGNTANVTMYCRPSSYPNGEGMTLQVWEYQQ